MSEPKTPCRTPSADGVTRIPTWKFDLVRGHILDLVQAAGSDGLPFTDLSGAVAGRLSQEERGRLGSVGWHVTTVKLEMECAGDIARRAGPGPQRLVLA